jgi:hypothetical protein
MRRELVNRQREEQAEAEVDEKADIDSVDSLICECGSSMPMAMRTCWSLLQCLYLPRIRYMRRDVYAMPTECGLRHQVMATSKTLALERRWVWKDGQIPLETVNFRIIAS